MGQECMNSLSSVSSQNRCKFWHILLVLIFIDGTSVIKAKVDVRAPRLHYVHPTCFEAGKPMDFVACGSNLLQAKFRYAFLWMYPAHIDLLLCQHLPFVFPWLTIYAYRWLLCLVTWIADCFLMSCWRKIIVLAGFFYLSLGSIWHMIIVLHLLILRLKGTMLVILTINCTEYKSLKLKPTVLVLYL